MPKNGVVGSCSRRQVLTISYDFDLKTIYMCVRLNEFELSYFLLF